MLAEFLPVYTSMGAFGWAQDEVDRMDVAVCARFLGRGQGDDEYPYVIRGTRSLVLPGDDKSKPDQAAANDHVLSVTGDDRRAAYRHTD